jgi:hypothetical protein
MAPGPKLSISELSPLMQDGLRCGGMLLRALDAEVTAGNGTPAIRRDLDRTRDHCQAWCKDPLAVESAETVPLRALVGIQCGAIVAAVRYGASRGTPAPAAAQIRPAGATT